MVPETHAASSGSLFCDEEDPFGHLGQSIDCSDNSGIRASPSSLIQAAKIAQLRQAAKEEVLDKNG